MSDLRHDPINDQWITMANNRRDRPMEYVPLEQSRQQLICPFCKGNEDETPPTLAAYCKDRTSLDGKTSQSGWLTRVVNNKYPSFSLNPESGVTPDANGLAKQSTKNGNSTNGTATSVAVKSPSLFKTCDEAGIQELIIPTPRHVVSLSELTEEELLVSFWVCQERIVRLRANSEIRHAMLFLNCRSEAGASLSHIHMQLMASPVIGGHLKNRVARNKAHVEEHGCSMITSIINWEIEQEERVLELTKNFCVVSPFASRFPFQIWIVPRNVEGGFPESPDRVRDEAAMLCQKWIQRYEEVMEQPSYNLLLHGDPFSEQSNDSDQPSPWYFELFPRLTRAAGFEWGTDIWVNPISPESAVRRLLAER